jgi:SAM-dependent methyltransferase
LIVPKRLHTAARKLAMATVRTALPIAKRKNWLPAAGLDAEPSLSPIFSDFNHLLHELRTIELGRMPRVTGTMLSAGCADSYYFDWLESSYQPVERHIGLEIYQPRPEILPDNVSWIENSVGQMTSVEDSSVALIFSGQNFEHLFGDDAPNFLLESHRVLRPDGWLVIDSPHREIAAALGWSQPEHTVEFTPAEACELVELAGFDVRSLRGLWLCQDPRTGAFLRLWDEDGHVPDPDAVLQRAVLGSSDVERSFVWWLEAQRADREPEVDALRHRHAEIFAYAWRERQQRLRHNVGSELTDGEHTIIRVGAGIEGHAMFGPYAPLSAGTHAVTFSLRRTGTGAPEREAALLEVTDMQGEPLRSRIVRVRELAHGEWSQFTVTVAPTEVVWGAQFRVFVTGSAAVDVRLAVDVAETGTRTAPSALRVSSDISTHGTAHDPASRDVPTAPAPRSSTAS